MIGDATDESGRLELYVDWARLNRNTDFAASQPLRLEPQWQRVQVSSLDEFAKSESLTLVANWMSLPRFGAHQAEQLFPLSVMR